MIECTRALPLDLGDVDVSGRRLEGRALAWDVLYRVTDDGREWYHEGFLRGSTAMSLVARRNIFELRREHADSRVGVVAFTEASDGLVFSALVDHGDEGDDELELVRSGRRRGVSVRYTPRRNTPKDGPPWWRSKVDLRELSLTARPQYGPDAAVAHVRARTAERYQRPAEHAQLLDWSLPGL
jgi:HK97 family phage prohead protease